jgi:hypothetical protein
MSVRVWAGPWVLGGVPPAYDAKAAQYCAQYVNFFPSNTDGSPASSWVLTAGRAADWTAAEADVDLIDIFAGDLPASVNTPAELRNYLRTRTIAQVPLARRNAITANLDTLGVIRTDFVGTTPLWKVFQRVASTLFERDANFAAGFNF